MNKRKNCSNLLVWVAWLLVASWLNVIPSARAAVENTFELLQIGTRTYKKVTVTTKSKDYIFILHSDGMTNIKVSELSPELREKLGYVATPEVKVQTNNPAAWAKQKLAKLETNGAVKSAQAQVLNAWHSRMPSLEAQIPPLTATLVGAFLAGAVAFYLFFCYCCALICRKAGQNPGVLVWIPLLQLFPMLRAAGMSGWWFLAAFVPLLNILAHVLWCFNIARARAKNVFLAVLLVLPLTNLLAFVYLAFADSTPGVRSAAKAERRVEIMTLDAV